MLLSADQPPLSSFRALLKARSVLGRPEARCLIVGEVAQAHDGSLGMAHAFIDAIAAAGARLPVSVSTGMSRLDEIDAAVERIQARGLSLAVLQCTSMYPCPPEHAGLNLIPILRDRYSCAVGLSDHSGTVYPGLAAATL